jgi:hypothetical protein
MKRPRSWSKSVFCFLVLGATACTTSFTGSATVEGGPSGCETKCREGGMQLVGMVYMGEYSDACVSALPGKAASSEKYLLASAAVAGGAAGVVMQKRREQETQANAANSASHAMPP